MKLARYRYHYGPLKAPCCNGEVRADHVHEVPTVCEQHGKRLKWTDGGPLTEREQEVLKLYAQGLTPGGIARQLSLSIKTVSTYLLRARRGLGLKDQHALRQAAVAMHFRATEGEICDRCGNAWFQSGQNPETHVSHVCKVPRG